MMFKKALWQGLTYIMVFLLAISITVGMVLESFRKQVDTALGTKSEKVVVNDENDVSHIAFTPDEAYLNADGSGNSKALIKAAIDLGRRQSAEGTVLLKNNGVLPFKNVEDVTLLGVRSHVPLLGSGMGIVAQGPIVNLEQALSKATRTDFKNTYATKGSSSFGGGGGAVDYSKMDDYDIDCAGYNVNPTMIQVYEGYNQSLGNGKLSNNDATSRNFNPKEPSLADLAAQNANYQASFDEYGDAAIVVVGRPAGESNDYLPGGIAPGLGATEPLALTTNEKDAIKLATDNFDKVVVLVNTNSAMEIRELEDNDAIDAILYIGNPGNYGCLGVADVLCGKENPSAALYDIYATQNMSAPAMMNMGNYTFTNPRDEITRSNSTHYIMEAESIYVGYRYYETRYYDSVYGKGNAASDAGVYASKNNVWNYEDEVTYGFGYGLSYTTFTQEIVGNPQPVIKGHEMYMQVPVRVTNTGDVAGKSIVQVYGKAPYVHGETKVEKSAIQLLAFDKTDEIAAGSSVTITIDVDIANLASYDMSFENADGTTGTYILDEGRYYFAVGNGAHDALNNVLAAEGKTTADGMDYNGVADRAWAWDYDYAGSGNVDGNTFGISKANQQVSNQLEYADWNSFEGASKVTYLSRTDWKGTYPVEYDALEAPDSMLDLLNGKYYEIKQDQDTSAFKYGSTETSIKISEMVKADWDDDRWDDVLSQMTMEEALVLAGYGGDTLPRVASVGITEELQLTENAGNGVVYTLEGTADPAAPWAIDAEDNNAKWNGQVFAGSPVVAATFNPDIMKEVGEFVGNESLFLGVPILWGPGLNTHRHAYNGRNGEYYSEDPVLAGTCAMEFAIGALEYGLISSPKHFAFNDQETNRSGVAPFMTEQRAREVELRAYQIAFEATKYDKLIAAGEYELPSGDSDAGMLGLMSSFSKIGPVECTCSRELMTNILCLEWGFRGYAVTDIYDDTDLYSAMVYSGSTGFDMRGSTNITFEGMSGGSRGLNDLGEAITTDRYDGDADFQTTLKLSNKRVLWVLAQSNIMNTLSADVSKVSLMTWWRATYIALISVTAVATAGSVAMYVLSTLKGKKEEE